MLEKKAERSCFPRKTIADNREIGFTMGPEYQENILTPKNEPDFDESLTTATYVPDNVKKDSKTNKFLTEENQVRVAF